MNKYHDSLRNNIINLNLKSSTILVDISDIKTNLATINEQHNALIKANLNIQKSIHNIQDQINNFNINNNQYIDQLATIKLEIKTNNNIINAYQNDYIKPNANDLKLYPKKIQLKQQLKQLNQQYHQINIQYNKHYDSYEFNTKILYSQYYNQLKELKIQYNTLNKSYIQHKDQLIVLLSKYNLASLQYNNYNDQIIQLNKQIQQIQCIKQSKPYQNYMNIQQKNKNLKNQCNLNNEYKDISNT